MWDIFYDLDEIDTLLDAVKANLPESLSPDQEELARMIQSDLLMTEKLCLDKQDYELYERCQEVRILLRSKLGLSVD